MAEKIKSVLIVDDEPRMREVLVDNFEDCNEDSNCEYEFHVDTASSAQEGIARLRSKSYDMIVLDIRMEEETSGLLLAWEISVQAGIELPIRIIFTGYPQYPQCVEAMRSGAWDYIVKEDVGNKSMFKIVVESALTRLRQLDLRKQMNEKIGANWLPAHIKELQTKYSGQLVAIWHQPEIEVITSGGDAFELEDHLREWRKVHESWEQPLIVKIPSKRNDDIEDK